MSTRADSGVKMVKPGDDWLGRTTTAIDSYLTKIPAIADILTMCLSPKFMCFIVKLRVHVIAMKFVVQG